MNALTPLANPSSLTLNELGELWNARRRLVAQLEARGLKTHYHEERMAALEDEAYRRGYLLELDAAGWRCINISDLDTGNLWRCL